MKRLAFLLLPLFVLAACENSIPTAIDDTDEIATAALIVPVDPADPAPVPTYVNLATATTIQLVVPNTTLVPASDTATHVTASGDAYIDTDEHTINAGCPTHFQDVGEDGTIDLILHFDAAELFPYLPDEIPADPVTVTLAVTFADDSTFDGEYLVQLVYNVPGRKGKGGRP